MIHTKGRLQYDSERGVVYFFADLTGECLLQIEGVYDVPEGHQIDIHLVHPGSEHHHEGCRGKFADEKVEGMICAVKLEDRP